MFKFLERFEVWSDKKWNEDMIRLGRDWLATARIHKMKAHMSKTQDVRNIHLKLASRYLTYAEAYLDMLKK